MYEMASNTPSLAAGGGGVGGCFFISGEAAATPSVHSAFSPWLLGHAQLIEDDSSISRSRGTI